MRRRRWTPLRGDTRPAASLNPFFLTLPPAREGAAEFFSQCCVYKGYGKLPIAPLSLSRRQAAQFPPLPNGGGLAEALLFSDIECQPTKPFREDDPEDKSPVSFFLRMSCILP